MTTEKQEEANRSNAQSSTGPTTQEGKLTVSKNATKHGIFSKEIIISKGDGKEDSEEFDALYQGLIDDLAPKGRLQHLLVEKIAVDFWRLRRVLRFETGSIRQILDTAINDYYRGVPALGQTGQMTNEELESAIRRSQERLDRNTKEIEALKSGKVSFEKRLWQNGNLKINIEGELEAFFDAHNLRERHSMELLSLHGHISFSEYRDMIKRDDFSDEDILEFTLLRFENRALNLQREIKDLQEKKMTNSSAADVRVQTLCIPQDTYADKVLRYEKSLQKSISYNLTLLQSFQRRK